MKPTVRWPIRTHDNRRQTEVVAVEEPLEIRLAGHSLAVTMRTPGHDFELAAGFLLSEGVVRERRDIVGISYCAKPQNYNVVNVALRPGVAFEPARHTRHVLTTSSCGICGKASIEQVLALRPGKVTPFQPPATVLATLPGKLAAAQINFTKTGGLHATALFDSAGTLLLAREDVGRHNAMDKLTGALLLGGKLPVSDCVVLVSGRASFELVQKAARAGIPALAAIGAPSSLAIELAHACGVSLTGFLRDGRFNRYTP
jgi:FdhD protein